MGKPKRAESDQRPGSVFNVRYALGLCAAQPRKFIGTHPRDGDSSTVAERSYRLGYRVAAAHRFSRAPVFQSKPSRGTTMSRSKVSILMSKYFSVGGAHAKFS